MVKILTKNVTKEYDVKNIIVWCIVDVIARCNVVNNAMECDVLQGNTGQR